MILVVDLATSSISLDEPETLTSFQVSTVGEPNGDDAVAGLLVELGGGRGADEADHVWVAIEAVRLLAADQVDEAWAEQFAAMLAYAGTKGWLDDSGTHIQAHIERP